MLEYLIWSEEHGAWWRPARRGYTSRMRDAGRYTKSEAERIAEEANAMGTFNEVPVELTDAMRAACDLPGARH